MVEVKVERELSVSANKAWALISDFGDISWAPGMDKVVVTGEGPGMVRSIYMPGDTPPIDERLELLDHDQKLMEYTIPGPSPMPVSDYRASAQVLALDENRCLIDWRCRAQAVGVSSEEAEAIIAGFYNQLIDWIAAALKQRSDN